MKTKKKLEVGQWYPGRAMLNEFGELNFVPEETGSRAGVIKAVCQGDGYKVSSTEKFILVHLKFDRGNTILERTRSLMDIFNKLITVFKEYEF